MKDRHEILKGLRAGRRLSTAHGEIHGMKTDFYFWVPANKQDAIPQSIIHDMRTLGLLTTEGKFWVITKKGRQSLSID